MGLRPERLPVEHALEPGEEEYTVKVNYTVLSTQTPLCNYII